MRTPKPAQGCRRRASLSPAFVFTVLGFVLCGLLAAVQPAVASSAPTEPGRHSAHTLANIPQAELQEAIDTGTDIPAIFAAAAAKPPLPYRQPLVGPVFKRSTWEWADVDQWTTAFLPDPEKFSLDFEMPQEERWIKVDLSDQVLVAYENGKPIRAFIISSGLPRTPTVTGEFRIRMKVRTQTMSGGDPALGNDYSLPNVEWVQYFFEDYGFHGTYWHKDFGQPKSHGCINMTNADAKWLFDWAGPTWEDRAVWQRSTEENSGTLVIVQE